MSNIWLISDTHFDDKYVFNAFRDDGTKVRPGFTSIKEMNEYIIECWNSVVKPNDTVWHLGDCVLGDAPVYWMENNWKRLNGKKNLVVGNHDDVKMAVGYSWFEEVVLWKIFVDRRLMLTHAPVHQNTAYVYNKSDDVKVDARVPLLNVHGHIHHIPSPEGRYHCVCVEQTNYTPINIDELDYSSS